MNDNKFNQSADNSATQISDPEFEIFYIKEHLVTELNRRIEKLERRYADLFWTVDELTTK